MSALICGSLAYDTIMVFPDQFKEHILPDKVHILNVAFLVPEMRREFGGVAGNISYNLRLLGDDPYPMATVGDDFEPYRKHLDRLAMQHSYLNRVADTEGMKIGIVAPDSKAAMIQHSRDFVEVGIPHIFDPGQGMTLFNGDELRQFIREARYIVVNDYEFQLLKERTGLDGGDIAEQVEALIVTRGGEGSVLRTREGVRSIGPVTPEDIQDPTGCGDAFRGGLIHGLLHDLDLVTCCRIGSVMGAIKVAQQGPQNHNPTIDEIEQRFFDSYGYRF